MIETLESKTRMLLLNALYFQGEWNTPFINEGDKILFHGSDGDSMVSKMKLEKNLFQIHCKAWIEGD